MVLNKARSGREVVVVIKTHPDVVQHPEFLNAQVISILLL